MQPQEPVPGGPGSMLGVQPRDSGSRRGEQLCIAFDDRALGIDTVRQQRKVQLAPRAREVVDLESLEQLIEFREVRQQHRDADQRTERGRNVARELELRQDVRSEATVVESINQQHRDVGGGYQRETEECGERPGREPAQQPAREQPQERRGHGRDRRPISGHSGRPQIALDSHGRRRAIVKRALKSGAAGADEVVARIPPALIRGLAACGGISAAGLRRTNCPCGDLELGAR